MVNRPRHWASSPILLAIVAAGVVVSVLAPTWRTGGSERASVVRDGQSLSNAHAIPDVPRSRPNKQGDDGPDAYAKMLADSMGVSFSPAPDGVVPQFSSAQALKIVAEDGIRSDVQALITPVAKLRVYAKTMGGERYAQNLLVWDVVFPAAMQQYHGPMDRKPIQPVPCDLHVVVDANRGVVLEGFQVGCAPMG